MPKRGWRARGLWIGRGLLDRARHRACAAYQGTYAAPASVRRFAGRSVPRRGRGGTEVGQQPPDLLVNDRGLADNEHAGLAELAGPDRPPAPPRFPTRRFDGVLDEAHEPVEGRLHGPARRGGWLARSPSCRTPGPHPISSAVRGTTPVRGTLAVPPTPRQRVTIRSAAVRLVGPAPIGGIGGHQVGHGVDTGLERKRSRMEECPRPAWRIPAT